MKRIISLPKQIGKFTLDPLPKPNQSNAHLFDLELYNTTSLIDISPANSNLESYDYEIAALDQRGTLYFIQFRKNYFNIV